MVHAFLLLLASQPLAALPDTPPVRVWLGATPSVYVQTATEGHLVVLHARPDGRVEVLYPTDPTSDPYVAPGTYRIAWPDGEDVSSGPGGRGMVVAALSPDPIWFDEFVHRSMWDVAALTGSGASGDPEGALTDIVQRMLGDGSFSYDVVTYDVAPSAPPTVGNTEPMAEPAAPTGGCVDCYYPPADAYYPPTDIYALGYAPYIPYLPYSPYGPHSPYGRRPGIGHRGPWGHGAFRDPPAIAAYTSQRGAVAPISVRQRTPVSPPSYAASTTATMRRRTVPTTFAARAVPLVSRARTTTNLATPASRSRLLVRYTNAPRNRGASLATANAPMTAGAATVAPRVFRAPVPRPAVSGIAVAAAPPIRRMVSGPIVSPFPNVWTMSARGGMTVAAPAAAVAGAPTGVGMDGVRTAGWRHR